MAGKKRTADGGLDLSRYECGKDRFNDPRYDLGLGGDGKPDASTSDHCAVISNVMDAPEGVFYGTSRYGDKKRICPAAQLPDMFPDAFFGVATGADPVLQELAARSTYPYPLHMLTAQALNVWPDAQGRIARRVVEFSLDIPNMAAEIMMRGAQIVHGTYLDHATRPGTRKEWQALCDSLQEPVSRLPKRIDQTMIDDVCRHVRVDSMEEGRSLDRLFDPHGRLHNDDGPAEVQHHKNGVLYSFYKNGQPHCLHGPWQQGVAEGAAPQKASIVARFKNATGMDDAKIYAIDGVVMARKEFEAHPQVIAFRAQHQEPGVGGKIRHFLDDMNSEKKDYDIGTVVSRMRKPDLGVQLLTAISNMPQAQQRHAIAYVAGQFHEDPKAASLLEQHRAGLADAAAANRAAVDLLAAHAEANGTAKMVMQRRDSLPEHLVHSRDAFDGMIGRVAELAITHASVLHHATETTAAWHHDSAQNTGAQKELDAIINGGARLPQGQEMTAVMQSLKNHYDGLAPALPDKLAFDAARSDITQVATQTRAGMQGYLKQVTDDLMATIGYLRSVDPDADIFTKILNEVNEMPATAAVTQKPPELRK